MRIRCIRMRALAHTGYRSQLYWRHCSQRQNCPSRRRWTCFRQFTDATRHPEKRCGRLPRFVAHQV